MPRGIADVSLWRRKLPEDIYAQDVQLKLLDVELYIDAASALGEDSNLDHEVEDLQEFLRAAWSLMTSEKKPQFIRKKEVQATLAGEIVDWDDVLEAELSKLP